jgi:hypothetical protein
MRRLAPVLRTAVLAGCEKRPPLVLLEWSLAPDQAGFVEAAFVTGRPVFREALDENKVELWTGPTSVDRWSSARRSRHAADGLHQPR